MNAQQAYDELIRRCKEASVLHSCADVLGWDERTHMPPKGSAHRAEQMALLARLCHEKATAPLLGELLAEIERSQVVYREIDGFGDNAQIGGLVHGNSFGFDRRR